MKKIKMPKGGAKLAKVPKIGKVSMGKTGGMGRKKKGMFG